MVKVCSNKFVQCALKQSKPLLMGNMAVFILLFCSWHYLLHVSLDYYKIRGLCVIIWETSLPVGAIGVDRHLPLSSRKHLISLPLPWFGATCHVYLEWASRREADLSYCLQLQSYCRKTHLYALTLQKYLYSCRRVEGSACAGVGRRKDNSCRDFVTLGALRTRLWKGGEKIIFSPLHKNILRTILKWRNTNYFCCSYWYFEIHSSVFSLPLVLLMSNLESTLVLSLPVCTHILCHSLAGGCYLHCLMGGGADG